jgi:hypothetical protein
VRLERRFVVEAHLELSEQDTDLAAMTTAERTQLLTNHVLRELRQWRRITDALLDPEAVDTDCQPMSAG